MLVFPEEKGTQLVSYALLPALKLPWATAIFTLETTLVSGKWREQPDPLPGPYRSLPLSPVPFPYLGWWVLWGWRRVGAL